MKVNRTLIHKLVASVALWTMLAPMVVVKADPPAAKPLTEEQKILHVLNRLGFGANALFVNRLIFAKDAANCTRCRLAAKWQSSVLANLKTQNPAETMFAIRNFIHEIVGANGLRAITDELWRLN